MAYCLKRVYVILIMEWMVYRSIGLTISEIYDMLLLTPLIFKNYKQWKAVITDSIMLSIL